MSWNGPCLQRNCFSKNYIFKGIVSQNPGMSRNYSQITVLNNLFDGSELALYLSKYPLKVISKGGFYFLIIHSKTRLSLQDTVITPKYGYHIEKLFPRPVFSHVFNSYFQTSHIKAPISKHSFDSPKDSVQSFRHSVTPSLRHFLTSLLFTFRQSKNCLHSNKQYFNSQQSIKTPSQQSVFQQSAIHQSQQSIKKPTFRHSAIPLFQKRC